MTDSSPKRRGRRSLGADSPSGKSPAWGLRLPPDEKERLTRYAQSTGESDATIARRAIREFLDREEKKRAKKSLG